MTTQGPDLTAVAIAVGEPLGGQVLDGQTRLAPVAVAGIGGTVVWRVRGESGPHPWQVYVGVWPNGSMRVLTADQGAWADLVAAAGGHLASAVQARSYVETYLEVTRGAMVIVQPVTSLDELRWRPGSDKEEAAKAALLADPPPTAPLVDSSADGFHVELTLVVDQRLQRNLFDLTSTGEIDRDLVPRARRASPSAHRALTRHRFRYCAKASVCWLTLTATRTRSESSCQPDSRP